MLKNKQKWFADKPSLLSLLFTSYIQSKSKMEGNLFGASEFKTIEIDLRTPEDIIFSRFKSNYRNEIRKILRIEGVVFDEVREIDKIGNSIAEKLGDVRYDNIKYCGIYNPIGRLITMHVYLIFNDRVRLLKSVNLGTDYEPSLYGSYNRALHWFCVKHFKSCGFKSYDFGGFSGKTDGKLAAIDKFKSGFGGNVVSYWNYISFPARVKMYLKW